MGVDLDQWAKELDAIDVSSLNKDDRMQYDRSLKAYRDYKNTIEYAREEGEEKGRREGEEKGRREGIEERYKEIVRNLKGLGLDISKIAEVIGLSVEEIEKLG